MPPPSCYICGSAPGVTKDHVFPRSLFEKPLPLDMITAPACGVCQQGIQPDEEVFRNFVAAGSYGDEAARAMWEGKVAGSFRNSPGLKTAFINSMKTVEWKSPGGVILGDVTVVRGDKGRTENVIRKIVRGLYFKDAGQPMPLDVRFHIEQVSPMSPSVPDLVMDMFHSIDLRTVGDIVRYKFRVADDEPGATAAWMAFYSKMMFLTITVPNAFQPSSTDPVAGATDAE
jgi:hypothetical protein